MNDYLLPKTRVLLYSWARNTTDRICSMRRDRRRCTPSFRA